MIQINMTENFLKQQVRCLDMLSELIVYDKEHGTPPENSKVLEAFIDTQRRALDMASKLLEKHKPALEEAEKTEREKQKKEAAIEAAKRKEKQKEEKVKEDLKKAQEEEISLFCCKEEAIQADEAEDEVVDDGYSFEEND